MMTRTDTQKNTNHNRVGNNVMVSKVYKMNILIGFYAQKKGKTKTIDRIDRIGILT